MSKFEIGVCLPLWQYGPQRATPRWSDIRQVALNAEQMGIDTLWIPDELLWRGDDHPAQGFWDCVSVAGAVAAVTSTIKIGSWVLSALHRNPGIIAKTAETLDEISGGRFVFGLGAGHAGAQAHTFGLPEDMVSARFEEALQVIVPLMRGGTANFEGRYHAARDLIQQPVGPRPNSIPLLIGAQKAKGMRYAALNGDIWSTYAGTDSTVEVLGPRVSEFERVCDEVGRDPGSIGRAAGVSVNPLESRTAPGGDICGSADEIADALRTFRNAGYTQVDLMIEPGTIAAFDALAPVVEAPRRRLTSGRGYPPDLIVATEPAVREARHGCDSYARPTPARVHKLHHRRTRAGARGCRARHLVRGLDAGHVRARRAAVSAARAVSRVSRPVGHLRGPVLAALRLGRSGHGHQRSRGRVPALRGPAAPAVRQDTGARP